MIKNTAGINHHRENVLRSVNQVEEVLARIKSDLAAEVKEDDVSASHANLEWWMASSSKLTKAIAEHDVAIAYGMGN